MEDSGIQADHTGVKRRISEELGIIICIVHLYIIASEADTYVKVVGLPGWRRRRKREKDQAAAVTQQSISWNKKTHDSKARMAYQHEKEKQKMDI